MTRSISRSLPSRRDRARAPSLAALALAAAALFTGTLAARDAHAQPEAALQLSLPAQPLAQTLNALSRQAGVAIGADAALLAGKTAPALDGALTLQQALDRALQGSGLSAVRSGPGTISIQRQAEATQTTLPAVRVQARADGETARGPVNGYDARLSSTATKTDTPILETPQSISVVSRERIEAIGATRLKEALAYSPGINTAPWGDESQYDWVYLRGFDAYSPGFHMDGLQLRNAGSWGVWQTENYGAERIELLRGPTSVLYGQNGPGGLVNVVSKRPTAEPLHELQLQLGDHDRRQLAGDFSGPLDAQGQWRYRLTGLVRDAKLSTGDMPNDRVFIAPALTWQPSADTSLTLLSQYLRMRNGSVWSSYPAIGTLQPNPNGPIPVGSFVGEPDWNRYDQDQWMLGYLFEHRLDDTWTLRQNLRHGRFDVDYKTFYGERFATVNAADPGDPANFRLLARTPFASRESARALTVDTQAQAKLRTGDWQHTLLFGLDYQRTRMDVVAYYGGTVAAIDAYQPVHGAPVTLAASPIVDGVTTLAQTGLYAQDQLKLGEHLVITAGARYDHATIRAGDRPSGTSSRQSDEKLTGRAGIVWLAPEGWAPYASYSESFSPITTIDPATGAPFSPESGRQYELGVRYQPTGHKGSYTAAVFDLLRKNYVGYDAGFVPRQTGAVSVRGLELEAIVQPVPALNLTGAYTWTPRAEVRQSPVPAEIGKQANAVAKHQLSLWADHRWGIGLKAGAGARYTGSTRGANGNAPAPLPSYTLFDAFLGYGTGDWELALHARNLADKAYIANCDGSGSNCSYGEPRKLTLTASYRW